MSAASYAALRRSVTQELAALGRDNAEREALWLVEEAAGAAYLSVAAQPPTPAAAAHVAAMLAELAAGRPFQYVLGSQDFYGLSFSVDERVLVPRPETETLVETALCWVDGRALRVLDLCCGSGAIIVTLAKLLPGGTFTATDISDAALAVARGNAERHGVTVDFHAGDLFAALPAACPPFDLICTNPPYLDQADMAAIPPELTFEPRLALDGGADGLAVCRRILTDAPRHLCGGGLLLMEIGAMQGDAVLAAARARGWCDPAILLDATRKPRFLRATVPHTE